MVTKMMFNNKKNILILQNFIGVTCICMSLFQIYTAYFGIFAAWRQRSIHFSFVILIFYLTYLYESYISFKNNKDTKYFFNIFIGWFFLILSIIVIYYMFFNYQEIIMRQGYPTTNDKVISTILVVLIFFAVFKKVSSSLFIIALVFWLYSIYGHILPGKFSSPFFTYSKIVDQLFNGTGGIFSSPLSVCATDISMFIIFGSFLNKAGATEIFNKIANMIMKNIKGGAAKAVIITNALVGTTQGSAVSVIGTTGTFCIPYLKSNGYKPEYNAAIVASSATGAMLMPPVMGAAAFLLASMTRTSYADVMKYGVIPAIIFYLGILFMTHFNYEKNKDKLKDLTNIKSININNEFWLDFILVFLPLGILIGALVIKKLSPMRSAFFALITLTIIWTLRKKDRLTIKKLLKALEEGAKGILIVSLACGCAGIIIGSMSLTGLGAKISALVAIYAVSKFTVLFIVMIVTIILGMGVPVAAAYIISAGILGGILLKQEIPLVIGHLFIFYFACMAPITPPVALASYAASAMAGASAHRVGFLACKLALPGFIIPFLFVYNNSILLMGSVFDILMSIMLLVVAIFIISMALEGWFMGLISIFERIFLFIIAIIMILPNNINVNLIAIFFFIITYIYKYNKNRNRYKKDKK